MDIADDKVEELKSSQDSKYYSVQLSVLVYGGLQKSYNR